MRFQHMTKSIEKHGAIRCPVKRLVMYMVFIMESTHVVSYLGPANICGLQDGCRFDQGTGILNCQKLDMQDIPLQLCPEVKHLDMRYNNMAKLSTRIHNYYPNLEKLDLGATQVTTISPKVFDECGRLIHIYLDSNNIRYIKRGAFEDLTSLQYLYLSGNKLTQIKGLIFDPLNKTLLYLDHSHNAVHRIQEGSFRELFNLQRLFLQHNQLTMINSGMFKGLISLTHLYLSNNDIVYVPHAAFKDMLNLQELKLGNNPGLISIHSGALNHLTQLSFLDLMKTNLSTLRNVSHLFLGESELRNFHIAETPLVCDESFELWQNWYEGSENHPRKTATCSEAPSEAMTLIDDDTTLKLSSTTQMPDNSFWESRSSDGGQEQMQVVIITAMVLFSLSLN